MANVTNALSTEALKEASLEALGYVCQDVNPAVMESKANAILTAIVHGMRTDEESMNVRLSATKALLNSLEFTSSNFENEVFFIFYLNYFFKNERNIIMEVTCSATICPNIFVRVTALQCLVKIISLYYRFMEPYMNRALFPVVFLKLKFDFFRLHWTL